MKIKSLLIATICASVVTPAIVVPMTVDASSLFKDVTPKHSYFEAIHKMRDLGIINGYPDGTFKPNETISRKHVAALLNRAHKLPQTVNVSTLKDVSTKHANYHDILAVQRAGIFELDRNGNFSPNKEVTRAEMAKALVIAFNLKGSTDAKFSDMPANHSSYNYVSTLFANDITTGDNGKFLPNNTLTRAHYAVFMYRAMGLERTGNKEVDANNLTIETLPAYIKQNPQLFSKEVRTNKGLFTRGDVGLFKKLITTDKQVIEKLGMKVTVVGGALGFEEPNYKGNPRPGYNTVEQVNMARSKDGEYDITFDFRSDKMKTVIPELVEYITDGYDVTKEVIEMIEEARLVEKGKGSSDYFIVENEKYTVKFLNTNSVKAVSSIIITPK
ncbi:S-layer homology domain-containing protein [Solibacillus sp. FSL K6-1554]|uniref:S-layer homology domain-containing protein n=1 Tax=Solibacillus sp. FSL K6-1554 TaxID=2921472 RepID=UPI0030F57FED